jgi:penicillin-binding protein 1A
MNGMYAPTGGNIDGGTYPADIWGEYMKQAKGKFCGEFKKPTKPFQSQPFLGHYSRQGGKDDDSSGDPGSAPDSTTTPADPKPDNGDSEPEKPRGDEPAGFDPNAYETPPQQGPGTESPGGTQAPGDG